MIILIAEKPLKSLDFKEFFVANSNLFLRILREKYYNTKKSDLQLVNCVFV